MLATQMVAAVIPVTDANLLRGLSPYNWVCQPDSIASALFEQDAASLLTKWMTDMVDARLPSGAFPMMAPDVHRFPWSPGWADSGVLIPWAKYHVYGDVRTIERYYKETVGQLKIYQKHSKDFVIEPMPDAFGDWLAPDKSTPSDLLATALYARCVGVMAEMARAVGKSEDAAKFTALHQSIRAGFQKAFVAADGTVGSGSQGGYVLALGYDLIEPELARLAADKLVAGIKFLRTERSCAVFSLASGNYRFQSILPTPTK